MTTAAQSALISSSVIPPMSLTPKADFLLVPRVVQLQEGLTHTFSDSDLDGLLSFFKSLHRPLVVDYEHQSLGTIAGFEQFKSPDGTAPAAGWINDMEVKADGLWAKSSKWTPRASSMMANGEYGFYSPTIFWAGKPWQSKPKAIGPVGLTNDPDINGLAAVAARCSHDQLVTLMKESTMDLKKLIAELMGLDANAPDDQFASACKSKWTEATGALTASKSVPTLQAKVAGLETELATVKTAAGEVTALKAAHGTELAALKATHAGEATAMKAEHDKTKAALAEQIATRFEETGRIATSDKAAVLEQAKTNPEIVLTAFKSVKVGAVVPVGKLGITAGKGAVSAVKSPNDHISTSKAFREMAPEQQQLHLDAVQYADTNKCTYAEAIRAVSATTAV